jgi:hypothetical protein
MKYRLTHEVLHYLKSNGFTILVGIEVLAGTGAVKASEFVFTPVEWDVEDFKKSAQAEEYNRHSFLLIDDLLKVDLKQLYSHRVIVLDD